MGKRQRAWLITSAVAVVAAFLGDTLTGSEASFSFFYLIAITLGTWFGGLRWGLWLSLMSAAGWTAAYFLTDGITEAQSTAGEMFGHDRLRQALADQHRLAPGDMRDRLLAAIERHTGGIASADDVTLLVLRAVAPGVAGSATGE